MRLKSGFGLVILLTACNALPTTETETSGIPIGEYADYQMSDNTDSLESYLPGETYSYKVTIEEVEEHDAVVYGWYAETRLKIPLGWYAAETNHSSLFMIEDQKTRITMGIRSLEGATFEELKASYADSFKEAYPDLKDEDIKIESLSENQFYIEVKHLANNVGTENGILNVITYNSDVPELYHSLLLVTPQDTLEHYEGLVGLILRDETINWEAL